MFEKVSYLKMYSRKVKKMVYKEYFSVVRSIRMIDFINVVYVLNM